MYNAPAPLAATTGLLAVTGASSIIVLIVAAFTLLAAGLALLSLVPRRLT